MPSEVLVMMPNPEEYAPYIRATFGEMEEGMPEHFPYSIVDREPRHESQLVDFFFNLLEFFDGRASNREVLDLLDSLPVRTRFEWTDEEMDILRKWFRDCHAYWGFNGKHRESLGSSNTDEHTWKHALERMVLGFVCGVVAKKPGEVYCHMMRLRARMLTSLPDYFMCSNNCNSMVKGAVHR